MNSAAPNADQLVADAALHLAAGCHAEAEHHLRAALTQDSRHPGALYRLGIVALTTGHAHDAEQLIRESLRYRPGDAAAQVNLGIALNAQQRFAEAIAAHRAAIALDPRLESAYLNQAGPLQALGRIDEAVGILEQARALNPARAEAWSNLGNLYKEQGRVMDALAAYDEALALNPQFQEAFSNRLAAMKLCPDITPADNLAWHRRWFGWFEAVRSECLPLANPPDPERPLRVGYLSPDCHTAVPDFIRPVWRAHAPAHFKVFAYFNNPRPNPDPTFHAPVEVRVMAGRSDADVAALVRADGIDVLIDLAGHTGRNRLGVVAREPAPVQMTWLDYLGTTGLTAMHHRITDAQADPPGTTDAFHSERLIRMPHTQWCWEPPADAPALTVLPALANGWLTFGYFNNYSKLTDATLRIWHRLLAAMPAARLLVAGVPAGSARQRIIAALALPPERLRLAPRMSTKDYRRLIGEVDIALDPTPFSGATTTLDALWQGVPVATLGGPFSWSRSTASLLTALGLPEWFFADEQAFVDGLQRMAQSLPTLAALRQSLRARVAQSPITDAVGFTRALEANIRTAWRDWCMEQGDDVPLSRRNWSRRVAMLSTPMADGARAGGLVQALDDALTLLALRPGCATLQGEVVRIALAVEPDAVVLPSAPPAARQSISFIICSIRPAQLGAISDRLGTLFRDHDVEVVGLTDARSLSEAYNRGARKARGDLLVFCHDDIALPQDDFADRLLTHLAVHDLIGVAGTSRLVDGHWEHAGFPHLHGHILHRPPDGRGWVYYCAGLQQPVMTAIMALDGVFLACRREVWEQMQFDEDHFDGFHLYDIDFSHRAALAGYQLAVPTDLILIHDSTGRYDPVWQRYNRQFLHKFPQLSGQAAADRHGSLNVKLATFDQILRVRAALLARGFGGIRSSIG